MMFMKMICKEKDVNASEEEKKQAEALNREFYVIDPKTGFLDVRSADELEDKTDRGPANDDPKPGSPVDGVISFLAEKSAERFDYMGDGMEVMTLREIVYRMEHTDPETAVVMLQSMFLANGMEAAAVDLDILNILSGYDDDTYETFIDELFDTEVFDQFLVANWLEEAFGKVSDHACLS